jgi:CRP-like cAMP-binding protein
LDPSILAKYFQRDLIAAGDVVISAGKFSDKVSVVSVMCDGDVFDYTDIFLKLYIVEDGEIEMVKDSSQQPPSIADIDARVSKSTQPLPQRLQPNERNENSYQPHQQEPQLQYRVCKVSSGSVFGEAEFFIRKPHSVSAIAERDCVLWTLSSSSYARMEAEQPHLCILFQHILLKNFSLHQIRTEAQDIM